MTDNTQSDVYTTLNPNNLTAADALQQLYSYTESTGADVGGVLDMLKDTPPGVRADGLIERIEENSDRFRAPKSGSDTHFTDLVGEAREAADANDAATAVTLLDDVIIDLLADTVDVFETVEAGAVEHHAFDDDVVDEIAYVRTAYEHMHELATYSRNELSNT